MTKNYKKNKITSNGMKKFSLFLIVFLFFFLALVAKTFAASISVSMPEKVKVGEVFEVLINVDSGGVLVNSVDMVLDYDESLLSFSGYKNEGSMMELWIDSPHEENGEIRMSGIIPGGVLGLYDSRKEGLGEIPITKLIFSTHKKGVATFSFVETKILKHDGKGTGLAHEERGGEIVVSGSALEGEGNQEIMDKEKPDSFEITFLEPTFFGRTPGMIIFRTSDALSGIKEYQLNTGGSRWTKVESPQAISKGIFSRTVTVRAYDFYGNFEDASVSIPGLLSTKLLWAISIFVLFCIAVLKMLKYKT